MQHLNAVQGAEVDTANPILDMASKQGLFQSQLPPLSQSWPSKAPSTIPLSPRKESSGGGEDADKPSSKLLGREIKETVRLFDKVDPKDLDQARPAVRFGGGGVDKKHMTPQGKAAALPYGTDFSGISTASDPTHLHMTKQRRPFELAHKVGPNVEKAVVDLYESAKVATATDAAPLVSPQTHEIFRLPKNFSPAVQDWIDDNKEPVSIAELQKEVRKGLEQETQ